MILTIFFIETLLQVQHENTALEGMHIKSEIQHEVKPSAVFVLRNTRVLYGAIVF